jgi:hypothetical protein
VKVKIYGKLTKRIYAVGQKQDCMRVLQQKYPSFREGQTREVANDPIFKEPLVIEPIR